MLAGLMMDTQLTTNAIMRFAQQVYPHSEIVSITADQGLHRYTYADAFARCRQLANALTASGAKQGDRIATLAWNDYRHLELYYAISGIGAVCHTINPRLFSEQIEFILNHAEDSIVFVDPMFVPLLAQLAPKLPLVQQIVVLCDDAALPATKLANVTSYEAYIANQPSQFEWPAFDEHTASSLCYTSGTTGNPKGVLYSHRSTILHAYAAALPDSLDISVRDVVMPIVPMFHANAWSLPYVAVMVGSKIVLPGPKMGDGASLYELIANEGVTLSAGVPTVWLALLAYLNNATATVPSLKRVVVGGAACPSALIDTFNKDYGVEVIHAWGMTETSPIGTVNTLKTGMAALPAAELNKIRQKQGRPVFGVELKLTDGDGREQPWDGNTMGEVNIRGPWIASRYYKLDKTDTHTDDGWLRTGDMATIDADGYMHITDRSKDVIKSGGEWISSIDLENAAVGHPAVQEAAVIGIAHPKWTERPLLVVVKVKGEVLAANDLLEWLTTKVAKWWLPDDVIFVDELPHTATGKISKKDLREQFKHYRLPTR